MADQNAAATKVQALQRGRSQRQQMAAAANKASKERRDAIYGAPPAADAAAVKAVEKTPETHKAIEAALTAHYLFKAVDKASLAAVIAAMAKRNFAPGDVILRQGQQHDTFYVIEKGSVDTLVDGSNVGKIQGPYAFGELGLLTNGKSPATIKSSAGIYSSFWMVTREDFRVAMSVANGASGESKEEAAPWKKQMATKPQNRGEDMFAGKTGVLVGCQIMRTIGTGTFGRVKLVQESTTKKIMALKCMQKARIFSKNQVANVIAERTALGEIDHPFVPKLFGTWQDSDQLYLFMEPVQGGDLWSLLYRKDVLPCSHLLGLQENTARAYAAMVLEALTAIHDAGYTYRGLKPEDLLMDAEGYLNVIDFGFAKKIPDGASSNTLCGTLEYLAPEMILAKGHNRAVDYWAYGILIYELCFGKTPFVDEHASKVCMKIVYSKRCLSLPNGISRNLRGILNALLTAEPAKRLGMARGGDQCVKHHPWFLDVDFSKIARKKYITPYRPEVSSELDYRHFASVEGEEQVVPFNADLLASLGMQAKGVKFLQDLFVDF